MFVFTDIFSVGLCWPISAKGNYHLDGSPSGGSPCLAHQRKTKRPHSLLGGEAGRGDFSRGQERPTAWQGSARQRLSLLGENERLRRGVGLALRGSFSLIKIDSGL